VALVRVELKDFGNARRVLKKDYYNKLEKIAKYLTTLKRPKGILRGAF
jgi:DNA-binding ferritin-like protein (Dps family)